MPSWGKQCPPRIKAKKARELANRTLRLGLEQNKKEHFHLLNSDQNQITIYSETIIDKWRGRIE